MENTTLGLNLDMGSETKPEKSCGICFKPFQVFYAFCIECKYEICYLCLLTIRHRYKNKVCPHCQHSSVDQYRYTDETLDKQLANKVVTLYKEREIYLVTSEAAKQEIERLLYNYKLLHMKHKTQYIYIRTSDINIRIQPGTSGLNFQCDVAPVEVPTLGWNWQQLVVELPDQFGANAVADSQEHEDSLGVSETVPNQQVGENVSQVQPPAVVPLPSGPPEAENLPTGEKVETEPGDRQADTGSASSKRNKWVKIPTKKKKGKKGNRQKHILAQLPLQNRFDLLPKSEIVGERVDTELVEPQDKNKWEKGKTKKKKENNANPGEHQTCVISCAHENGFDPSDPQGTSTNTDMPICVEREETEKAKMHSRSSTQRGAGVADVNGLTHSLEERPTSPTLGATSHAPTFNGTSPDEAPKLENTSTHDQTEKWSKVKGRGGKKKKGRGSKVVHVNFLHSNSFQVLGSADK